jgi:hypothetical protein
LFRTVSQNPKSLLHLSLILLLDLVTNGRSKSKSITSICLGFVTQLARFRVCIIKVFCAAEAAPVLKLIAAGKLALMSKFDGAVAKESSELLYACILIWLLLVDVIQMKGPPSILVTQLAKFRTLVRLFFVYSVRFC